MTGAMLLLCLFLAAALSQGRFRFMVAGLSLPALVIAASLSLPLGVGAAAAGVVFALATGAAWAQVIPAPVAVQCSTALGSGIAIGVSAFAGRLAGEIDPVLGSVVFAGLVFALEKFGSRSNPFGEWGSLAHSQTGMWWALAIARWGPHAVTLVLVLVSGSIGFALAGESRRPLLLALAVVLATTLTTLDWYRAAKRDRVGSSTPTVGLIEADEDLFTDFVAEFVSGASEVASTQAFDTRTRQSLQQLLDQTAEASLAGAEMVVWAEGAGVVSAGHHPDAVLAAQQAVRRAPCVLVASWIVLDPSDGLLSNVTSTITADGAVATTTGKRYPVPGSEAEATRSHDDALVAVDTELGRLGVAICFDADHHDTWKQLELAGVEIVAIPASDWPTIGQLHADMARLRSRSIGAAIVRPARAGVSTATDASGRLLARVDHRHTSQRALTSTLPR